MQTEKNTLILGTQWGDEGKGKITHYLARRAHAVARYSGGNNAGHTVVIGNQTYKLHQIPSGIFYDYVDCILGNGMVIDPEVLLGEIDGLRAHGLGLRNLSISLQAHIIMPYHRWLDNRAEERRGEQNLGTTGRGIGPAYADKASRVGIRAIDLLDEESLRERIEFNFAEKKHLLTRSRLKADKTLKAYREFGERLRPYMRDTSLQLHEHWRQGHIILFEGAQGALLDVDHGTYPYVTSSNAGPGYAGAGLGLPPRAIEKVLGVVKAYTTRVGSGPFPTELNDARGEQMRRQGEEFGTTTGRPRRCGWLDLVALRTACRIHGVDSLAITKLDVLRGFHPLQMAVAYRLRGKTIHEFPLTPRELAECEPVLQEVKGWDDSLEDVTSHDSLPTAALDYLQAIEHHLDIGISMVSVGARDDRTLERDRRHMART